MISGRLTKLATYSCVVPVLASPSRISTRINYPQSRRKLQQNFNQPSSLTTAKKGGRPGSDPSSIISVTVTDRNGTYRSYDLRELDSRLLADVLRDLDHLTSY